MTPRVTWIHVSGFKSLRDVRLSLDGLSVLIGDNGSGKSSILEVLELLRSTTHPGYVSRFASAHGGLPLLLENGAQTLRLAVEVDTGAPHPLYYFQIWKPNASTPDEIIEHQDPIPDGLVLRFDDNRVWHRQSDEVIPIGRTDSLVFAHAPHDPHVAAVAEALRGIDVHLPFQVTASWASRGSERQTPRSIALVEPTTRLDRFGNNVVNAYQALKNDFGIDHWNETLEYIQLGLGSDVRDVRIEAIPGGGHIALALETHHQGRVPAFSLADGVLSYLAFVAMFRLDQHRTLLAFDEPELHMHPGLLARVLGMLEAMAERYPVVLATHSDRLLDGLSDPAASVVVTELDEDRRTCLRRLDADQLSQWIDDYRGLGELRADGELPSVLAEPGPAQGGRALTPTQERPA